MTVDELDAWQAWSVQALCERDVAEAVRLSVRASAGESLARVPCSYCGTRTTLVFSDGVACCVGCTDARCDDHLKKVATRGLA